jgi:hypothetical protein
MSTHEDEIVDSFFLPERRERYRLLLRNPRRRKKALDTLNHNPPIDPRFATPVKSHLVEEALRQQGAPATCYVISAIPELDGREMALKDALQEAEYGYWGTIIGCIPGRLALYLGEGGERRLLLRRTS